MDARFNVSFAKRQVRQETDARDKQSVFGLTEYFDTANDKGFDKNGKNQIRNAHHDSRPSKRYFR